MCWIKELAVVSAVLLALTASCLADEAVTELNIEVTHLPDDCADKRKSQKGDQIKMHYTGTLVDGTKFDSSFDRAQPMDFQLGVGMVIKGWDQGLTDMCVGEKRRLTIPQHLAYGEEAVGDNIPAGSTLIFETELMDIKDGEAVKNIFKEIDTDSDEKLSRDEIASYLQAQSTESGEVQNADDPQFKEMIDNIMHGEDKDEDGFISHDEFSGPKHDEL